MDDWQRHNRIWLPRTGQTTSYDTGDDGAYEAGMPPGPALLNLGDDTVYDPRTDLQWGLAALGAPTAYAWTDALAACEACTLAGYTDWRPPNRLEMASLINHEETSNPRFYDPWNTVGPQADRYWSSTTRPGATTYAYYCSTTSGLLSYAAKTTTYYVLPVRRGRING